MSNLIKLFISIAIVTFILYKLDFSAVWQTMLGANISLLAAALIMQLLSQTVAAYRWYLIMDFMKFPFAFGFYFKSYFKGSLFNQVLPTSIGGDAYRVAEVATKAKDTQENAVKEAFYGVFIDRVVGLVGLLLLNLFANLFHADLLPDGVFMAINVIILSALVGLVVLAGIHKFEVFNRTKITRLFYQLSERFRLIYKTPKRISQQLGLSVLIHLFSMIAIFGIGHSLGINEPLVTYLLLVPPAILLTILPISFAGWGLREGALIGLFLLIGIDETLVLAMSLLYGITLIIAALPGLVFFIQNKHKYL